MLSNDRYQHDSRCTVCGKMLNKTMMSIHNVSLSQEDYVRFRRGTTIKYGSQTTCRRCKKLREISSEVEYMESYGGTE